MLIPAPGLLTIIIGLPNRDEAFWRNGRAKISKSDPASATTIHMIGFTGYSSALGNLEGRDWVD